MALSPAVRAELNDERESLLRQRQKIDDRLAAIDMLAPRKSTTAAPRLGKRKSRRVIPATVNQPLLDDNDEVQADDPVKGTMRPMIREVLGSLGFLKPGEVIRSLRAKGFVVTGKTPLEMRVYNELKRMMKEGVLVRDDQGRYALKGRT